jgi:hypothetical protein
VNRKAKNVRVRPERIVMGVTMTVVNGRIGSMPVTPDVFEEVFQ